MEVTEGSYVSGVLGAKASGVVYGESRKRGNEMTVIDSCKNLAVYRAEGRVVIDKRFGFS